MSSTSGCSLKIHICVRNFIYGRISFGGVVGEDFSFASGFNVKPSPNCLAYMSAELGVREPSPATLQRGRLTQVTSFSGSQGGWTRGNLRTPLTLNLLMTTDNS